MTANTTRRGFLKSATATTAVLIVGLHPNGTMAAGAKSEMLTPFVKIHADGTVTAILKHFEKGQGPATGLTTLIAEELGVSMDDIRYEFAPSNPEVYNNLLLGPIQGTVGSTAMANSFLQYRNAGAAAREMLIAAAAERWGIDASSLTLKDGMISGGGNSAHLAEFVGAASQMTPPETPKLKDPAEFTLIGNPSVKRKDTPSKINGTAQYAMDVHLPNQMVVVVARTPRMGGKVSSIDDSKAQAIKGFIQAAVLPTRAGVAVYAENTWAAMQARDALDIEWDQSEAEERSSGQVRDALIAAVNNDPTYNANGADPAEVNVKINAAETVVEQTFYFPLLAHSPMEPLTCTLESDGNGGVILHDGCQLPTGAHEALAQVLQLPMEKIDIRTMLAGGSFGRRVTPTADYHVEAAMAFALTDQFRPVKLVWSREDDITGGYYRPAAAHRVRVGVSAGKIVGWDHRVACQSVMKGTAWEGFLVHEGVDHSSIEGVAGNPYQIPGQFIGLTDGVKATSVLWWRSVGHSHTAYVMESMMDLIADAAGADPVEFRLSLLDESDPDQARLAGVLKLAAEKGGWGKAPKGHAQGIAVHKTFGSYVAELVEVSGTVEKGIQIEKVTGAVDCGLTVNPDIIKAQIEGGIGYGLGHAMRDEITLTEGAVDQSNFPDYPPLRIGDIGEIEVHIVPSAETPTGVGEPGTPPSAPALANAIARTGLRVTSLPMIKNGVSFA